MGRHRTSLSNLDASVLFVYDLSRVMPTSYSSDQNIKEKEDVTLSAPYYSALVDSQGVQTAVG